MNFYPPQLCFLLPPDPRSPKHAFPSSLLSPLLLTHSNEEEEYEKKVCLARNIQIRCSHLEKKGKKFSPSCLTELKFMVEASVSCIGNSLTGIFLHEAWKKVFKIIKQLIRGNTTIVSGFSLGPLVALDRLTLYCFPELLMPRRFPISRKEGSNRQNAIRPRRQKSS